MLLKRSKVANVASKSIHLHPLAPLAEKSSNRGIGGRAPFKANCFHRKHGGESCSAKTDGKGAAGLELSVDLVGLGKR